MIPQRAHELPALAIILGAEQAARQGAAPEHAGLIGASRNERPDAHGAPGQRPPPHVILFKALRLLGICRRGYLLPAVGRRAVHFHTEVAVVERRIALAATLVAQRQRHVVGEEIDFRDFPAAPAPFDGEQALARGYQKLIAHDLASRECLKHVDGCVLADGIT
jgi:hypothetical protein